MLLQYPAKLVASELRAWTERQRLAAAAATAAATPVGIIHRQGGSDAAARPTRPAPASNLPPAVALGLRRLSLFLERLRPQSPAAAPAEQRTEVASQFMTAAAVQASTEKELAE